MNYIANVLYDSRTQSCLATVWNYKITNTSSSLEERAHFDFVMSEEVWGRFWSLWGDWEDVSLSQERGWDRRIDIQEMVWKFLNLDMSEQTDELIALLIGGDEEDMTEDTRKQVYDIYLQESEMNGWAGYRR
jgi:hypothetical protein